MRCDPHLPYAIQGVVSNCFQLETIGPVGLDLHHEEERWSGRIVEVCHATFERGEHQSVFSSKMEKISVRPMMTFTSKTASVGFEGIVNLLLGDRATGRGYEREPPLRFPAMVESLSQMLEQFLLLWQRQRVHGRFDFSKRAHGPEAITAQPPTARFRPKPARMMETPVHEFSAQAA